MRQYDNVTLQLSKEQVVNGKLCKIFECVLLQQLGVHKTEYGVQFQRKVDRSGESSHQFTM